MNTHYLLAEAREHALAAARLITDIHNGPEAINEKWSIVVYLSRFAQAAIFSMLSCTPSLNTTPSMT
jgi:hypothetical protein